MQALPDHPVVLYDGPCGLCQRSVRFVLRHERGNDLRFAAIQSDQGQRLLSDLNLPLAPEEMVFIEKGEATSGADAVFELCRHLRYPAKALGIFRILPRPLTRWGYQWIARRRTRWFSTTEHCVLPGPEHAERFLET